MPYDLLITSLIASSSRYDELKTEWELVSTTESTIEWSIENIGDSFPGGFIDEVDSTIPHEGRSLDGSHSAKATLPPLEKNEIFKFTINFTPLVAGVVQLSFKIQIDGDQIITYYRERDDSPGYSEGIVILPVRDRTLFDILLSLKQIEDRLGKDE